MLARHRPVAVLVASACLASPLAAEPYCPETSEADQVEQSLRLLEAHGERFAPVILAIRAERARPSWQFAAADDAAEPLGCSETVAADARQQTLP